MPLENLLANPNKIAPVNNFPALPWREIARFMVDLVGREGTAALAVQFAILTRAGRAKCAGSGGARSIWTRGYGPFHPSE